MSEAALRMEPPTRTAISLKSVALPVEHGGWGMLGEPLLLGLLVAPSRAGFGVGLASLGVFLARHPLKLALADWRRGSAQYRTGGRTRAAVGFVLLYGAIAGLGLALASGGGQGFWLPLALASPLALTQLAYDARHRGRQLVPELLGAVALASVVAAEMRAAGLPLERSLAAWALLAAKSVGAVLYVRARLRSDRGLASGRALAVASNAAGLLVGAGLAATGYAPWLAAPAFTLLLARALYGLSRLHQPVRPQVVGFQELAYGVSFVLILAVGYLAQL